MSRNIAVGLMLALSYPAFAQRIEPMPPGVRIEAQPRAIPERSPVQGEKKKDGAVVHVDGPIQQSPPGASGGGCEAWPPVQRTVQRTWWMTWWMPAVSPQVCDERHHCDRRVVRRWRVAPVNPRPST
jgi:hypothetical protein